MNAKMMLWGLTLGLTAAGHLAAWQFTPPAIPPGVKSKSETVPTTIVKVYSLDDQGVKYRAYVVKYKGAEVVAESMFPATDLKVGDSVNLSVVRVEVPQGGKTTRAVSFKIVNPPGAKKTSKPAP